MGVTTLSASGISMKSNLVPIGALILLAGAQAEAATYALSPDGNAVVRVTAVAPISSASFDSTLVTSAYPGWSVTKAGAVAGSSLASTGFDAAWSSATSGGANFTAAYAQPNAVPAGRSLDWVQVVTTNVPLPGQPSPRLDPSPSHGDPLYRADELLPPGKASTTRTLNFIDGPSRSSTSLSSVPSVDWKADLYQVEYDGAQSIIVRDGLSWGWNMKPATVGNSAGRFLNPSPNCPPATCSGVGSNSVSWGTGSPGSLSFASAAFAPRVGDLFKIGTLTYQNGATFSGSEISGVDLDIDMSFTNIGEANFTYHSRLSINNTPNTADPIASADFVAFTVGGFSATFNVQEGATASADLMARLTPTLTVNPLGAGGASGDRSQPFDALSSPIGFDVTLVGFANPSAGGFVSGVPEPGTYVLMIVGSLLLAIAVRRQRAAGSSGPITRMV